jgi:hypothetical protein
VRAITSITRTHTLSTVCLAQPLELPHLLPAQVYTTREARFADFTVQSAQVHTTPPV